MRLTCIVCTINLIILSLCGGIYALSDVNVLYYVFFKIASAERAFYGICAVSALFEMYALIVFKPFKGLK